MMYQQMSPPQTAYTATPSLSPLPPPQSAIAITRGTDGGDDGRWNWKWTASVISVITIIVVVTLVLVFTSHGNSGNGGSQSCSSTILCTDPNQACVDGTCQVVECSSSKPCASTQVCVGAKCVPATGCSQDAPYGACPAESECVGGACVRRDRPCSPDDPSATYCANPNEQCIGGQCRLPPAPPPSTACSPTNKNGVCSDSTQQCDTQTGICQPRPNTCTKAGTGTCSDAKQVCRAAPNASITQGVCVNADLGPTLQESQGFDDQYLSTSDRTAFLMLEPTSGTLALYTGRYPLDPTKTLVWRTTLATPINRQPTDPRVYALLTDTGQLNVFWNKPGVKNPIWSSSKPQPMTTPKSVYFLYLSGSGANAKLCVMRGSPTALAQAVTVCCLDQGKPCP